MSLARDRAALGAHQAACRACHICVEAGIIAEANPTFMGEWGAPFFLVGQAPGPVERVSRRPFSGRAGKELDRWMMRAGFVDAAEFRSMTYIASLMRCFPGRNRSGSGDLKPSRAGIANCAPWLESELRLLQPRALILVGQMAIATFIGAQRLEEVIGKRFGSEPVMVPLPHPSGQSRWLNDAGNRNRLSSALSILGELRSEFAARTAVASGSGDRRAGASI